MNQNSTAFAILLVVGLVLIVNVTGIRTHQRMLSLIYSNLSQTASAVKELPSSLKNDVSLNDERPLMPDSYAPGEILVKFKPGVPDHVQDRVLSQAGVNIKRTIPKIEVHVISVPEKAERQVKEALGKNPRIEFTELNHALEATYATNDPLLPDMWHHQKIGSENAWSMASSTGITIAILDSGSDTNHPDLASNLVGGYNVVSNSNDFEDIHGHGTSVAGSASAVGNNSNQVVGVAYDANIMTVRISESSDSYATWADASDALVYAADNGARVANLSYLACGSYSINNAGDYLKSKGGLAFVSAGNSGDDPGFSLTDSLICVSATGSSDTRPSWSSYGDYVDISAPGVSILTTSIGGGTKQFSGTSASSPVAAGLAALVWGANPDLTNIQVEDIIKETAVDLGEAGWDKYYGWGRIDAASAVAKAMETSDTPVDDEEEVVIDKPSVTITHPSDGATVSGAVTISTNATSDETLSVEKVEMYINESLIGTDSSDPFSFYWDTSLEENGEYVLQARVFDTNGNSEWSNNITVTVENVADSTSPTIQITEPEDGANIPQTGGFAITASAQDNTKISQIDILFDGIISETCTGQDSCSFTLNANKLVAGKSYKINAIASDENGNTAEDEITITIVGKSSDDSEDDTSDDEKTGKWCEPWPSCRK
ncbi:MAG: S8 family peptidase [Patescibacteria group bacterium]